MNRNATLTEMVAPLRADAVFMARLNDMVTASKARNARERGLLAIRNNLIDQGKTRQAEAINALN